MEQPRKTGRNLIVCCDGTNNQIEGSPTNVLRLASILESESDEQIVYYDPGVGTFAESDIRSPIKNKLYRLKGLAFGAGFKTNLMEAYRFLMENYQEGDRLCFFGFSRGAFTVRALAGMIKFCGLLDKERANLLEYAVLAYIAADWDTGAKIREKFSVRGLKKIHFLGLWDTVSTLGFVYSQKYLPYTANNNMIVSIRHAAALDERRSNFDLNRLGRNKNTDLKEVWFPGVHSDVGGGYEEERSKLAYLPLFWMVKEFEEALGQKGLWDEGEYRKLFGVAADEKRLSVSPSEPCNESMVGSWNIMELLPLNSPLKPWVFRVHLWSRRNLFKQGGIVVHPIAFDRENILSSRKYYYKHIKNMCSSGESIVNPYTDEMEAKVCVLSEEESYYKKGDLIDRAKVLVPSKNVGIGIKLSTFVISCLLILVLAGIGSGFWHEWLGAIVLKCWSNILVQGVVYLMLAFLAFKVFSPFQQIFSGYAHFSYRLKSKPAMYSRFGGYDTLVLQKQFDSLKNHKRDGNRGIKAFRWMLFWDGVFALIYTYCLVKCSVWFAERLCENLGEKLASSWWHWGILLLPIFYLLFDWVENMLLCRLSKVDRITKGYKRLVTVASWSTRLKLGSFILAMIALPVLVVALWIYQSLLQVFCGIWGAI